LIPIIPTSIFFPGSRLRTLATHSCDLQKEGYFAFGCGGGAAYGPSVTTRVTSLALHKCNSNLHASTSSKGRSGNVDAPGHQKTCAQEHLKRAGRRMNNTGTLGPRNLLHLTSRREQVRLKRR
jgi:hypothetical protein